MASTSWLWIWLQAPQAELKALTQPFADREDAIRKGLILEGKRFEVTSLTP